MKEFNKNPDRNSPAKGKLTQQQSHQGKQAPQSGVTRSPSNGGSSANKNTNLGGGTGGGINNTNRSNSNLKGRETDNRNR